MDQSSKKTGKFTLLMYSMSTWRDWQKGVVNRNWHILNTLLKDERIGKIYSVDFFPFNFKKKIKYLLNRSRKIGNKLEIISTYWPKKVKKIIPQPDIVWSYNPMYIGYFALFENACFIFDAVDNWAEHPSFVKYKNKLLKNYQVIAKKSNVIFTVADKLRELFNSPENAYWIPNGVDINHFTKNLTPYTLHLTPPIIGYVGVIQKRINFALIKYLAEKNPEQSFVLAGPVWREAEKHLVKNLTNVHFLGYIPYQELPSLIHSFDVCIIPHKINEFTQSMDPLKMYDYLACGKPIVSTPVAGVSNLGEYIEVAVTPEEFNEKINKVLKEDNEEKQKMRLQKAEENSWQKRISLMLELCLPKNTGS